MFRFHLRIAILWIAVAALVTHVNAQAPNDAVAAQLKAMEERIKALEAELQALKAAVAAPSAPTPTAPAQAFVPTESPAPQAVSIGGATGMGKVLNPDISFIGDFLGAAGNNPIRPTPSLEMHESEVGLQAIIDPYARADVFLTFGEQGVNVEEAFLTFTSLPGGFRASVGKMRAAFGKVNTQHNHVLPWTDRPMATDNLVGGEDGINDAGFSVTRILPAPKGIFLDGTAQIYRGDSGDIFTSGRRTNVSVVGHLRGYGDISESTNLEIGASYARGHNDGSPVDLNVPAGGLATVLNPFAPASYSYDPNHSYVTNLYGTDVSLRWKPLRRAIYHSFLLRNELFFSNRGQYGGGRHSFGQYTMAEYRVNRRWTLGGRYDYTERARTAGIDRGFSGIITYWPSEFTQIRSQYRFGDYAERVKTNELRFQFLFVMGAHGAHPF